MANTPSAAKRAKQGEQRRQRNVALRSRMRTAVKKITKAIEEGDTVAAAAAFRAGAAELDSTVNKGLTHKNKAARRKSRLNKAVKALGTDAVAAKAAATAKASTRSGSKSTASKKKVTRKKATSKA
ncbi:MAG: 30S ribosomal protein S20 [Gammaproteobacteria bacterium PRO9]|nr:30S ribosomal protein S20 [Gammaproteobacteria bacterium PRO9]